MCPDQLVEWDGVLRVAVPDLETWAGRGRGALQGEGVNWPARLGAHCRYLADTMRGGELYDLWLRTGHSSPQEWEEFLCEGEGVFGDCLEEKRGWPGEADCAVSSLIMGSPAQHCQ